METVTLDDRAAALPVDLAGPDATFRPHQFEAVRDLVDDRARVLCVQRTGWGKSASTPCDRVAAGAGGLGRL